LGTAYSCLGDLKNSTRAFYQETASQSAAKPSTTQTSSSSDCPAISRCQGWGVEHLTDAVKGRLIQQYKAEPGDDGSQNLWLGLTSLNKNGCDVRGVDSPTSTNTPTLVRWSSCTQQTWSVPQTNYTPSRIPAAALWVSTTPHTHRGTTLCTSKSSLQTNSDFVSSVKKHGIILTGAASGRVRICVCSK